jgi:spore maturation protein CgeB
LHIVDGIQNPYVFGEARNQLINRSRIMVNLLRESWDDNSLRISLAAHNKALLISEPMLPHSQFQPGAHIIVAPIKDLPATIAYYLENESERQAIVERAYQFIQRKPNSKSTAVMLIEQALAIRENGLRKL